MLILRYKILGPVPTRRWKTKVYIPLTCNTPKIQPLVAIFRIDAMRVDRTSDVVLFYHYPVIVHKSFGDHVKPAVGKTFSFFLIAVALEANPRKNLLRCPPTNNLSIKIQIKSKRRMKLTKDNPIVESAYLVQFGLCFPSFHSPSLHVLQIASARPRPS